MELFEALQISALKSVLQPDDEYFVRRVFRWYSEKFHTPLNLVADLPLEDVLQAYFECSFENMSKRKLNSLAKDFTKIPADNNKPKKPRKPRKKVQSDDDFVKKMQEASKGIVKKLEERREEIKKVTQNMMDSLDDVDPLAPAAALPEIPEIHSKFNSNLE